jgi:hypothetical protein
MTQKLEKMPYTDLITSEFDGNAHYVSDTSATSSSLWRISNSALLSHTRRRCSVEYRDEKAQISGSHRVTFCVMFFGAKGEGLKNRLMVTAFHYL